MVKFEHVTFAYNKAPVIEDLTLHIPQGQVLGLLGHNGAGKTTTLRLILGLVRPRSGRIQVGGLTPGDPNMPRALVSYMPELNGVYEKLSGFQNLEFRARAARVDTPQIRPRSEKLLEQLGLLSRGREKAGFWSKGMKQRLSLACTLICQPRLLLLDEPTNGLDPESLSIVIHMLQNVKHTSIVLSSHDLNSVCKICDHVAILQNGQLVHTDVLQGTAEALQQTYLQLTTGGKGS
jgi:ABC-type multidrug transport system ATPase subunit